MSEYSVHRLCGDALGLMDALGHEKCFVVGHDWGCWLAWMLAVLHPEVLLGVAGLSVPYGGGSNIPGYGEGKGGLLTRLKRQFGDPQSADPKERTSARYIHILHHDLPGARESYEHNLREALYIVYCSGPGGGREDKEETVSFQAGDDCDPPAVQGYGKMYVNGVAEPMWRRICRPRGFPPWFKEEDLDVYVREFRCAQRGFQGALNWYRAKDLDWVSTSQLTRRRWRSRRSSSTAARRRGTWMPRFGPSAPT